LEKFYKKNILKIKNGKKKRKKIGNWQLKQKKKKIGTKAPDAQPV